MDPPGFGLESFSPIGKSRTVDDEGFPLDTTGVLKNGQTFTNARGLAMALTSDKTYNRCGVRKLTSFALGRKLVESDKCTIEKILNSSGNKTLQEIITDIIASDIFRYERGG
jgi:hypothetical protein